MEKNNNTKLEQKQETMKQEDIKETANNEKNIKLVSNFL